MIDDQVIMNFPFYAKQRGFGAVLCDSHEVETRDRAGVNAGRAADAFAVVHRPCLAKFITSMPMWQTLVQTPQEMHFFDLYGYRCDISGWVLFFAPKGHPIPAQLSALGDVSKSSQAL